MHLKTRNISFVFAALLCCIFVMSCKREPLPPEPPSDPELTVKNELPPFGAGGGNAELRFTTNRNWEIAIEPLKVDGSDQDSAKNWYDISPLSGGPNAEGEEIAVKITVQTNEQYDPCGFVIVLKTKPDRSGSGSGNPGEKPLEKRIEVTQSKKNAIIIGENRIEVPGDGQTVVVKVRSNVDYGVTIQTGSEWIDEAPARPETKGLKETSHSFLIAANPAETPRTGVIVFKDNDSGLFDELTIIQAGMEDPNPERAALRAIYKSLGGDGWTRKDNWCDMGKPLDKWYGVETDPEGHVVGLRLRRNNLKGIPSKEIANLIHLRHLDLSWNALSGKLGIEYNLGDYHLGNLVNLDTLDISHNDISGTMLGSKEWGRLKKMRYLNVSSNNLTGWVLYTEGAYDPNTRVIELIANDNCLHGMPEVLYSHPDYDRLALQIIRQRDAGWDRGGGGIDVKDLKKPIHLPDLTFTDLRDGSKRNIKEVYQNNTMTMLFYWDPTNRESNKFIETFVLKYHTLYRNQGFEAIAILPQDEENPGSDKYKSAARQYLASHDVKWMVAGDYRDDQGRRIVLLDHPNPGYMLLDQSGNLTLDIFKGGSTIDPRPGVIGAVYKDDDLSGLKHMEEFNGIIREKLGDSNYESVDYSMDKKPLTLQKATRGNGVDIVILGEAFTDVEIKAGYYEMVMRDVMEYFFAIEPTKSYREYFNVYSAYAVSKKCWPNKDRYQTAMGTTRTKEYSGYLVEGDPGAVEFYAEVCPIKSSITTPKTIIVNNTNVGKCIIYDDGSTYAYASNYGDAIQHESIGHGFGLLADEYAFGGRSGDKQELMRFHAKGIYLNVDTTDDPERVKWSHLIGHKRFPYAGIFIGGYYTGDGTWKSEKSSLMDCNTPNYFNAWSRELIVKRILTLSGEGYTFEKFLLKDSDEGRPGTGPDPWALSKPAYMKYEHHLPIFIERKE